MLVCSGFVAGGGVGGIAPHFTLYDYVLFVGKFASKNAKFWAENLQFGEFRDKIELLCRKFSVFLSE